MGDLESQLFDAERNGTAPSAADRVDDDVLSGALGDAILGTTPKLCAYCKSETHRASAWTSDGQDIERYERAHPHQFAVGGERFQAAAGRLIDAVDAMEAAGPRRRGLETILGDLDAVGNPGPEWDDETTCPRCEKVRPAQFAALSRADNETYICNVCGDDEAMRDLDGGDWVGLEAWPVEVAN